MSSKIRVLVVDDSAFARKVLRDVLMASAEIEVVGIARDGLEALEKVADLKPDVITLDLIMPNLDGLGVLDALAPSGPRVVVVSTADGESELAIRALERGAVELVTKPTALATDRMYELGAELLRKVKSAAQARVQPWPSPLPSAAPQREPIRTSRKIVAIGTSTGGPQALTSLLCALPANFPVPIVVALHIPPGYTRALAQRIDASSRLTVVEAEQGMELRPGLAAIAQGGSHLTLHLRDQHFVCEIGREPGDTLLFPSVDVLFESVVRVAGGATMGVVLTGMGDDGMRGAGTIRRAGGVVLTQSAASCVVYGMPRCVVEAGDSDGEAPLASMAELMLARL